MLSPCSYPARPGPIFLSPHHAPEGAPAERITQAPQVSHPWVSLTTAGYQQETEGLWDEKEKCQGSLPSDGFPPHPGRGWVQLALANGNVLSPIPLQPQGLGILASFADSPNPAHNPISSSLKSLSFYPLI